MGASNNARTLQTTQTSLNILEEIRDRGGATMAELAESESIAKSTVHGHLSTLRTNGYIIKEGERYYLDLKFLNFAEYARKQKRAYELIPRYVDRLAERTHQETDFSVEQQGRIMSMYVTNGGPSEPSFQVGNYYYMTRTAPGKAILAQSPDEKIDKVIDQWGLPKNTPHSITTREELEVDLERTRNRGYAINDQECTEGLRTISRQVNGANGRIVGALTISGPTYKMTDEIIESEFAPMLLALVKEFESEIAATFKP